MPNVWPTQAEAHTFYGKPGTGTILYKPPFEMYYETKPIRGISIHQKCERSLDTVLQTVWRGCGENQKSIDALGISNYSGCLSLRTIRGSISAVSMHSYAAALDFDAEANPMTYNKTAGFFTPTHPLVIAFKNEGWIWGGDWSGRRDPMHFQAARVR